MIRDLTIVNRKETSNEQGGDGMGGDKVGVMSFGSIAGLNGSGVHDQSAFPPLTRANAKAKNKQNKQRNEQNKQTKENKYNHHDVTAR
jgi:hypothetical protein